MCQGEPRRDRNESSDEVTDVPDEEGRGDEDCGIGAGVREDAGCEDWEAEHCSEEGHEDACGEEGEFAEESCETDGGAVCGA